MGASETARDRIFATIDRYIADPEAGAADATSAEALLDADTRGLLLGVLADKRISYRDGVIIQLGWGVADPGADLTLRNEGARTLAQQLGVFFAERHIAAVKDAYQNIAKNTNVLNRGNVPDFDALLVWANGADAAQREAALQLACAAVAATARPVRPMPRLNRSLLTFARCSKLIRELLATPSAGAFEQFTVAALLNTLVADTTGAAYRVETKSLNASDRSSYAAGDVQIVTGNRVIEAFEVTANDWRTKLVGASKTIRDNDLSRLHIVASRLEGERPDVEAALDGLAEDVAVLDVRQVAEVLIAVLTRPQRAEALTRLYEYLDRYQSDVDRVNLYVERLTAAGLVEGAGN